MFKLSKKEKILIIDADDFYGKVNLRLVEDLNYVGRYMSSTKSLSKVLQSDHFSIVLLDISVLNNSSEDIIKIIREANSKIHILLTTIEEIDNLFSLAKEKRILQILHKPIKSRTLKVTLEKLLNPSEENWFSLENYIENINKSESFTITNSNQITDTVTNLRELFKHTPLENEDEGRLEIVWTEMISNAVFHAHGHSQKKLRGDSVALTEKQTVTVSYADNGKQFGVSVRDNMGKLTGEKVIATLIDAFEHKKKLIAAFESDEDLEVDVEMRGRGFDLIRSMLAEYYIVIHPNKTTEIIVIYEGFMFEDDNLYSNLQILELN